MSNYNVIAQRVIFFGIFFHEINEMTFLSSTSLSISDMDPDSETESNVYDVWPTRQKSILFQLKAHDLHFF